VLKFVGYYCDKNGKEMLGSDGVIVFDGRWSQSSRDWHARRLRLTYQKHFRSTWEDMRFYKYPGVVRPVADHVDALTPN
jgi:hypothetical protein